MKINGDWIVDSLSNFRLRRKCPASLKKIMRILESFEMTVSNLAVVLIFRGGIMLPFFSFFRSFHFMWGGEISFFLPHNTQAVKMRII